ncbi:hypothetical protein KSS87_001701 [Heliosperma pusillum]|nr:hypothetical protein KSS87_001701 [Heliosperma pusillum]
MSIFFRKLAKSAPLAFSNAFKNSNNYTSYGSKASYGAFAALSGGISLYYFNSSSNLAYLDSSDENAAEKMALSPDKWLEFKLHETANVSHNTKLYRFTFDPDVKLGLDIASCLLTRAPAGQNDEGKTKYVIRPPIEKLRYTPNMKKHIGMIAGGSGVTPMLQVAEAILKNQDDKTQVSLIYANVSPDDILLKQKLDILATSHPNFKVFYTVDKPSENWKGGVGYVSKDMVSKGLPVPSNDTLVLVCGPPGMMQHISGNKAKDYSQGELSGVLKELGYTEEMVYKF